MIGDIRYWAAGNAHQAVIDRTERRVKVAVVGCEPAHPLIWVGWIPEWRWS